MPFVRSSDGTRIYWRLDGRPDKPPLVMVSSLGSDHAMWNPVLAGLEREFHVLRLDKRGHGASEVPVGDYALAQLGRDVLACADAAGWQRFHYAGLSIGGMIGMWLAQNASQRLDRLVLSNTAARIRLIRSQGMPAIVDTILGRFFTGGYLARRTIHAATVRSTLLGIDPDGYAGCCAAIRDMAIVDGLARIATPTLVIAGTHDPSTPAVRGREIAEAIPGARYLELPTAHFGHSERPRRWLEAVVPFLDGRPA
jgi:3-oxoadipate enol-lactonase/4-carboxymuconolactone decarboxylase